MLLVLQSERSWPSFWGRRLHRILYTDSVQWQADGASIWRICERGHCLDAAQALGSKQGTKSTEESGCQQNQFTYLTDTETDIYTGSAGGIVRLANSSCIG